MPQCCCGSWRLRCQNSPFCTSKASTVSTTWFLLPLPHCCARRVCACSRVLQVHTRWRCVCETGQRLRERLARSCGRCSRSTGVIICTFVLATQVNWEPAVVDVGTGLVADATASGGFLQTGRCLPRHTHTTTYTHNDIHTTAVSICRTHSRSRRSRHALLCVRSAMCMLCVRSVSRSVDLEISRSRVEISRSRHAFGCGSNWSRTQV